MATGDALGSLEVLDKLLELIPHGCNLHVKTSDHIRLFGSLITLIVEPLIIENVKLRSNLLEGVEYSDCCSFHPIGLVWRPVEQISYGANGLRATISELDQMTEPNQQIRSCEH